MNAVIQFQADFYGPRAVRKAALQYNRQARFELSESATEVVARLQPLAGISEAEFAAVRDGFCTEALCLAARERQARRDTGGTEAPWPLVAPFTARTQLALGWVLESLGPVTAGAAIMELRHERFGSVQISIRRHAGRPRGVAYTGTLDFLLLNDGGGNARTEGSIERVLKAFAKVLRSHGSDGRTDLLGAPSPTEQTARPNAAACSSRPVGRRIIPHIDVAGSLVTFDLDGANFDPHVLDATVLALAERCYVLLARTNDQGVRLQLKPRAAASVDELRVLARDATRALNRPLHRETSDSHLRTTLGRSAGLPTLQRPEVDMDALLGELEAADPWRLGLGFEPQRGPGHDRLRVLNILGTGACNSDCAFCCEKFNPLNRLTPNADTTRQLILNSANQFDMLFFASGEPTIHPHLFDYVDLARRSGFACFGMSSHFRTFSDPRFALKTLLAGFDYFDISLHAADLARQIEINPIDDGGASLPEALKGLAVLFRLAEALGRRISVTHKIVVSRHNVTQLEPIFRATYDRGVRHFIVQPVRLAGLSTERQALLAIEEEEILPYLNALLERAKELGAVIKPYGFSRRELVSGEQVETEQNRLKNVSGRVRGAPGIISLPTTSEVRPTDGRHWIELKSPTDEHFGFAADADSVILDQALQRGAHLTFGCRMGSCGMCCARLVEGEVDQSTQIFLTDEQVRDGYVLLCQARPLSNATFRLCTEDEIDPL